MLRTTAARTASRSAITVQRRSLATQSPALRAAMGVATNEDSSATSSPRSFYNVFSRTPFGRMGAETKGILTRAKVLGVHRNTAKLDLGSKFPAYCVIPEHQPIESVRPGMEVSVQIEALDFTKHITGDAKPIAAYEANVIWKSLHTRDGSFRKTAVVFGAGDAHATQKPKRKSPRVLMDDSPNVKVLYANAPSNGEEKAKNFDGKKKKSYQNMGR